MDNEDQSRSDQAKASQGGDLMAEKKTRDLYEDTRAGPSYCDKMIGHAVDARIFESACLDYDSDDSVKDKTYEPHKDILDDSYVSDSPEKVFVISRSLKVKRKLSFSEESPQRQSKMANNEDNNLITLENLLGPRKERMSATLVFCESSKEHDRFSAANGKKNKDDKDFRMSECVWLQVKHDQPGILSYKNTFEGDFCEISFIRNASKWIQFPQNLPSVSQSEKPISTAKYNDLMSLLQWIPQEFHTYYKNFKHLESEADYPEIY
ncbi:unnamed protein product [Parnassius apollo]|uniref:(apollo) hypothetical protein n=1 Tax=Parnassius apollo TaxID=110799 RepID=A0A8S3WZE5_PARAO|nr:unnamed protein product [Parnassius apollo]